MLCTTEVIQKQHRVLIVDDHELASSGLAYALAEQGRHAVVGILTRGRNVLRQVRKLDVDVVLLDINLPDVSGLDVLVELVSTLQTKVIILTSENRAQDLQFAIKVGAKGVVSKADPIKTIITALDIVVIGGSFVSPYVNALIGSCDKSDSDQISLSPRQRSILNYLAEGETNKEISYRLSISAPTVSFHLRELRRKLGVAGNKKILNRAAELGLLAAN